MKIQLQPKKVLLTLCSLFFSLVFVAQAQNEGLIHIWPGKVPGETAPKHPAVITDNHSGEVTRLTDVTDPTLKVFLPDASVNNGAAVIVCPGGGYKILAIDKEGHEVAEWLTTLGYTAFVLEYRVPEKQDGALNDIQRAIRIVRSEANDWKLDPDKIGVIGFSAGGSLAARAGTMYNEDSYAPQDAKDKVSSKPNFAMLIYPAYLDKGENRSLTPELKVDENTPPMFLFATADDSHANSALVMATALRDNKVPVSLHLLPKGGHGYGLRAGNPAGESWPALAESWLKGIVK
ncbi:alpha/beta hydrolase [Cyclobacterium qasimii]|uniref:Xylanase n=2 Tax=Cyclobacterium qasimii TaxID=1350429 RepID=S7X376_9BACT|nr:alpha/beta hydrolase [Cyclobacterium qasimii]EPR70568.1 Xylanase [Cyclobacterium qasimii M12-11B]GEO22257.1 xylanase [Cyclobacterium qasimii]